MSEEKPKLGDRLKTMLAEYGKIALGVYLGIFVIVFGAAAIALQLGFEFESAAGSAGTVAGAWLLTKVTQPLRILATLALTPAVAAIVGRQPASAEDPQKPSM